METRYIVMQNPTIKMMVDVVIGHVFIHRKSKVS
jgi:hypothetical protein